MPQDQGMIPPKPLFPALAAAASAPPVSADAKKRENERLLERLWAAIDGK